MSQGSVVGVAFQAGDQLDAVDGLGSGRVVVERGEQQPRLLAQGPDARPGARILPGDR